MSEARGQTSAVELRAIISDAATGERLGYATALSLRRGVGTAADDTGLVVLPGNRPGDTVAVSYVGYATAYVVLTARPPSEIALEQSTSTLGDITVVADDDYLYDVIREARRRSRTDTFVAKTYFFLETEADGQRAELIEGFYNGTYVDYGTAALAYEKSRLGVRIVDGRAVTSASTSRLFTIAGLFAASPFLPSSPLSLPRRRARKAFDVDLANRYTEDGAEILAIAFAPRDGGRDGTRFGGTL